MLRRANEKSLGTSSEGAEPGDYALGSPQSRAAARAILERRFAGRRQIDLVSTVPRPGNVGGIYIGVWIECDDGSLFRFSSVPPGMTIEEAERIVAQRPEGLTT